MQLCIKILLSLILNEAQRVSGDTPPITRSLKLHKQPLVLHTWKVVGRAVGGHCQVAYATWQRPPTACPRTFHICKTRGCLWTTSTNCMSDNLPRMQNQRLLVDNVHQLHVRQPSTYAKPEAACAVLGSWWWAVSPETCWAFFNISGFHIVVLFNLSKEMVYIPSSTTK
jgi:hypothetical protein